jgi:hypothetical protein
MGFLTGALFVGWRRQARHARTYRTERDNLADDFAAHLDALCEAAGIPCCHHCGWCGGCSINDYCTACYEAY